MSKREYLIRDLTIDDEYDIISSTASVLEAAKKMKEVSIPDLVVIDEDKNVLGVVADFDIVQNVVAEGIDPKTTNVLSVMYTITPVTLDTPIKDAFQKLRDLEVNVVPVVDENNKLIGVATIQDMWSYIPVETVDDIGFIEVEDPKNAEFWLAGACGIIALFLGWIFPLIGIYGFMKAPIIGYPNEKGLFSFFEARGTRTFISFFNLINSSNGILWIIIILTSTITILLALLGFVSLIYASYSDLKGIRTGTLVRMMPVFSIASLILEWLVFISVRQLDIFRSDLSTVNLDYLGLIMSILSIILLIVAVKRDIFFRKKEVNN